MKVVHLITQDFGGAGNAAYRLHKGLQKLGVDSTMIVLDKKSCDPSVIVVPEVQAFSSFCESPESYKSLRMKFLWKYWSDMLATYPDRPTGLEIFTDNSTTVNLNLIQEIKEADIINLHWVAGMINYKELPSALKNKNIVWTLHDMNPFTGGCHYTGLCTKFLTNCSNCIQLGSSLYDDISHQNFTEKLNAYTELVIHLVTPSNWLGKEAGKSKLFSKYDVEVIPYGLPTRYIQGLLKNRIAKTIEYSIGEKNSFIWR